jgi:phytoene dehydrogenase-like protein
MIDDAIIIGAGPNGLVAANHLADHGWSVTVLEAEGEPGGAVRSGELILPGFNHDLFSAFYPLAAASPAIRALSLEEYGLRWRRSPLVLAHPLPDGRCPIISTELETTAAALDGFASGDGRAWTRMIEDWDRIAKPFLGALLSPFPPLIDAARLAWRLGALGSLRLARHALLPVRRMAEEIFTGEGGGLLLGGSALHSDLCPEAAGSGLYGWLLCCLGQRVGFPVPEGGARALTASLVERLQSKGGAVRCGCRVTSVVVRRGRAVGVTTASGDLVEARNAVLADVAAPLLYTELVGERHLPAGFLADLRNFQWDTSTVKVDWALRHPVPWRSQEAASAGTVHVADDFDNLTEFSSHLAMGCLPARPFLLFGQQSLADPTRSPAGTETAWAYTHVPRRVRRDAAGAISVAPASDSESWLRPFVERMEGRIEALAPGFREAILGRHVSGPGDLERRDANLDRGAIGGGTAQLHQQLVFRPVPGTGRAETPIANLYLASSSAHPGGGVHGAAGANAAKAALLGFRKCRALLLGRGGTGASTRRKPRPYPELLIERPID